MKAKIVCYATALAISSTLCFSAVAGDWVSRGTESGVALYEKVEPGQDFHSFRGVVRVHAPMRSVLSLILVRETFPKWVAGVLEDSTLPTNNADGSLCYMWIKGTWPSDDRDVVARVTVEQDPQTLAVSVIARDADPALVPETRGRVRMRSLYSGFIVRPIGKSETEVELIGQADPGGQVPSFAANAVSRNLPRDTLSNLVGLLGDGSKVDTSALATNRFASLAMQKIRLPAE